MPKAIGARRLTPEDRAAFNRWRFAFFIVLSCAVLIALAAFAQEPPDQSVYPPDWSDARRQRSLIKQLLSPFPSFCGFICIGHFMIQAASDQVFLLVVISVCPWDVVCLGAWVRDARRSMTPGQ